jgi:transposase-like protein
MLLGDKKPKEQPPRAAKVLSNDGLKNSSKRNYGNRVTGPWVFGLVVQKLEDIDAKQTINANYAAQSRHIISNYKSKSQRRIFHQDKRKLNTKERRNYNGRKYAYTLVGKKSNKSPNQELRMFVVQKRDAKTLIPLIKKHIKEQSEIVSDQWSAYSKLNQHNFVHHTVNHSENFVNPTTGKHTQLIECLWGHAKTKIMRNMHGTSEANLPAHLAERWFRSLHDEKDIFKQILPILRDSIL